MGNFMRRSLACIVSTFCFLLAACTVAPKEKLLNTVPPNDQILKLPREQFRVAEYLDTASKLQAMGEKRAIRVLKSWSTTSEGKNGKRLY
jgi:hypothetical protein